MIKKLTFILLAASCMQSMYSQNTEKNEKFLENKTLFEELKNKKTKHCLLRRIALYRIKQ